LKRVVAAAVAGLNHEDVVHAFATIYEVESLSWVSPCIATGVAAFQIWPVYRVFGNRTVLGGP
jgi:hypothetical protein